MERGHMLLKKKMLYSILSGSSLLAAAKEPANRFPVLKGFNIVE